MARSRKRHQLYGNRPLRLTKPHFETLEDRIAPGSLLDLFGMAAIGSMQGNSDNRQAHTERAFQSPTKVSKSENGALGIELSRLPALELLSADSTSLDQALVGIQTDDTFDFSSLPNQAGHVMNSMEGAWRGLSGEGLDGKSLLSYSVESDMDSHHRASSAQQRFSLGGGSIHLPGAAFQPGAQTLVPVALGVAWPATADAGLSSSHVGTQHSARASSELPAGAGAAVSDENGAMMSALSDTIKGSLDSLYANAKTVEDHRLPPELWGRTDDLLAGQSLFPYSVSNTQSLRDPTTGAVKSPTEYDPMRGVLYSYASYPSVVTDLVKELTEDPDTDDIAYVVVNSQTQQNTATSSFINAGADMSKVQFFIQPMNSVWMRDYGPHFVTVDDALAIVDSHYYPTRSLDNFIPTLVGDNNFNVPSYDMGLYFSGGNFQPGPNQSGFVTALVNADNPTADGFDTGLISELHQKYLGIETLHVLPQLPFSVDGTGHIDMWMYLVDHETVIISEFLPGSNSTAIQITNNAVGYMEDLGFKVYRTPAWNSGGAHYTYANAFRVNNRIFVPVYGTSYKPGGNSAYNSRDDAAISAWQAAAGPGVEIIPIQCAQIIFASGAIHCIVKQVPRYTGSAPAVNILSPAGGEVLSPASQVKIEWSAIDVNNTDPTEIIIYVAYGNSKYQHIATTTDVGSYVWNLDGKLNRAESATIKIIARSSNGNKTEVISRPFSISPGKVLTHDFSSGAGVDKFAYGSQTSSWSSIDGNPFPVSTQLTSTNYARLATSNAVGGNDADTNRYIAPVPSPSSAESTHLFTFQLSTPVAKMAQLEVLWEGYGDFATQVELYVWDRINQNWGNGAGLSGVNRYMDSWAGNIDGLLTGAIRSNFSQYVDDSGTIRFLIYTDRPGAVGSAGQGIETFHDYMAVKVKQIDFSIPVRMV